MAISPRLELRQAQSLTMTPQLMQSIRLLQLSHLEINAFVEAELLRNPLLEAAQPESDSTDREDAETTSADDHAVDIVQSGETLSAATDVAATLDTEVDNVYPEQVAQDSVFQSTHLPQSGPAFGDENGPDFDRFAAPELSLTDHLSGQIAMLITHPGDLLIARTLVDHLDEAGYLTVGCEPVAEQLGAEIEDVEAVLDLVQGCEPVGVFARSLSECLRLQLIERDHLDPMMDKLIDHIDLLASHELPKLMRQVGCDKDDLADMISELKSLDPRPGLQFDGASVQTVVPDVHIRERPDGTWAIELNAETLPRVLVNRTYYATVTKQVRSDQEKEFLVDCLQTANWLTKSLDQRAQTILKVATEIVRQQDGFFAHGVSHLKPMTLKMVADEIDMHESTVSRVTVNKYMATPRGLFEMRYFFTTALGSTSGGDDHSSESVRHFIKQIVDAENPKKILSDDAIAKSVKEQHGIDVARRTVTKYREALDIPSSVIRRRQKRELT